MCFEYQIVMNTGLFPIEHPLVTWVGFERVFVGRAKMVTEILVVSMAYACVLVLSPWVLMVDFVEGMRKGCNPLLVWHALLWESSKSRFSTSVVGIFFAVGNDGLIGVQSPIELFWERLGYVLLSRSPLSRSLVHSRSPSAPFRIYFFLFVSAFAFFSYYFWSCLSPLYPSLSLSLTPDPSLLSSTSTPSALSPSSSPPSAALLPVSPSLSLLLPSLIPPAFFLFLS